jgi:hypothetical protein
MKQIVAYLYPTPEQLDRLIEQQKANAAEQTFLDVIREHFAEQLGVPSDSILIVNSQEEADESNLESLIRRTLEGPRPISDLVPRSILDRVREMVVDADRYIPESPCGDFIWRTHTGQSRYVSDMASPHIFYAMRMIFNHSVPPAFRVLRPGETMNRYPDVPHWCQAAINAFNRELEERDDLDKELADQWADMKSNTAVILALGI